jgi:hypothetical protein
MSKQKCHYCGYKFTPMLLVQHLFRVHRFKVGFWGKYGVFEGAKRRAKV